VKRGLSSGTRISTLGLPGNRRAFGNETCNDGSPRSGTSSKRPRLFGGRRPKYCKHGARFGRQGPDFEDQRRPKTSCNGRPPGRENRGLPFIQNGCRRATPLKAEVPSRSNHSYCDWENCHASGFSLRIMRLCFLPPVTVPRLSAPSAA